MAISIELSRESEMMLKSLPKKFKKGILDGLKKSSKDIEKSVKRQFGSAGSIKNRSGFLMNSIKAGKVKQVSGDKVSTSVGTDTIYAAIHEFGGVITPRASEYLQFKGDFGWVSVKKVVIPQRPYFEPGVKKAIPSIKRNLYEMVQRELT